MKKRIIILLLLFSVVFIRLVLAQSFTTPVGSNIRAISMGGAHVAIADDENALYVNPAGLTNVKGLHIRLNALLGADKSFFEAAKYIENADTPMPEDLKNFNSGENQAVQMGGDITAAIYGNGWGIGLAFDVNSLNRFGDISISQNNITSGKITIALAKKLWILSLGSSFNLKVNSTAVNLIPYGGDAMIIDTEVVTGLSMDVGAMLNLPLLRFGLSIKNVASSNTIEGSNEKFKSDPIVSVGGSARLPNLPIIKFLIKDIIAGVEIESTKNDSPILKLGAEAKFINIPILGHIKGRLGAYTSGNRVGTTLGLGLRLLIADIDLAIKFSKPQDAPNEYDQMDATVYAQASLGW